MGRARLARMAVDQGAEVWKRWARGESRTDIRRHGAEGGRPDAGGGIDDVAGVG